MLHTLYNAEKKLWSGRNLPTVYNPKASMGHIILAALQQNPEKVIQVSDDTGIELTAGQIRSKTIYAAQNLQRLGYRSNDVFGFMSNNNHNVAPLVYAALCLGCPINAIDSNYEESEIVHAFGKTLPKVIFCESGCYEILQRSLEKLGSEAKVFILDGVGNNATNVEELFAGNGSETDFIPTIIDTDNHIAAIVCSSGTTGLSKQISISHALLTDIASDLFDMRGHDINLSFSTLFWITGILMTVATPILGARRIITTKPFSPEYFFHLVEKHRATMLVSAPYHCGLILKCASLKSSHFSSVKTFLIGGSRVPTSIVEQMNRFLPNGQVRVTYGLSEIGIVSSSYSKSMKSNESCGHLLNRLEAKIIDESGKRLGIGEDGELCVRNPIKMLGYYKNPMATEVLFDDEGFMLTGDVGHFDENGYLHLVDRKKDIFPCYELHIHPSEIENVLLCNIAVNSVCVVGIPDPDDVAPDLTAAVIVKRKGYDISIEEIHAFVADHLPKPKQLFGGVYFVESFPITPSGKIIRKKVLEIATSLYNEQRKNGQRSNGQ